jgi:hypothetical protein
MDTLCLKNLEMVDDTSEVNPTATIKEDKHLDDVEIEPQENMEVEAQHVHENY